MIRINKPDLAPAILRNRGHDTTIKHQNDYDGASVDYDSGKKKFKFKSSIYGAKSVKNSLIKAQHSKCAFCESKFTHIAYGDVEHFRPKGGYKQKDSDDLQKPGYYWLAYEWSNLYASCQICNQRFKKNLFPLKVQRDRSKTHHADLSREEPLLIDLGITDPSKSIGFRAEYPFAINGNKRGETTIAILGLDREELATVREDRLKTYELLKESRDEIREIIDNSASPNMARLKRLLTKIEARIENLVSDDAEYAAMARAVFAN